MNRMVPGIAVIRVAGATLIQSTRSPRGCGPSIWIEGMPVSGGAVDRLLQSPDVPSIPVGGGDSDALVQPQDVEAIEVYRDALETPVEFGGAFNSCGAVVIWTR